MASWTCASSFWRSVAASAASAGDDLDDLIADVEYHDLVEGVFEIGDVVVRTQYLNHPALTLGYRIEVDGRSISVGLRLSSLGLAILSTIDGTTRVGDVLARFPDREDAVRRELRALQRRLTQLGVLYVMAG